MPVKSYSANQVSEPGLATPSGLACRKPTSPAGRARLRRATLPCLSQSEHQLEEQRPRHRVRVVRRDGLEAERPVEAIFNLGTLGRNDTSATPMSDLFRGGIP